MMVRQETFETFKDAWAFLKSKSKKDDGFEYGIPVSNAFVVNVYDKTKDEKKAKKKEYLKSATFGVIKDIEPYESPIEKGKFITSRRERRYELQANNCREVDPSEYKPVYRNERFMQKHGIVNKE